MALDWTNTAGVLKVVVIVLGVAIVVATAALAVEIFRRAGGLGDEAPPAGLATATVPLPAGARVIDVADGDGDTVSVLVERVNGRHELITVDLRSGEVLGTITFEPEP
jgi:hypothetical protein